jgi:hypothetical protein
MLRKLGKWKFRSYLRLIGFWYFEVLFSSFLDEEYKTVKFFLVYLELRGNQIKKVKGFLEGVG